MVGSFIALQEQIVECSSITGLNNYVLKIIKKDPFLNLSQTASICIVISKR